MDAYLCLEAGIHAKFVTGSTGTGNIWDVQDESKICTIMQGLRDDLGEAIR
jgi:hypothetical protein